MVLLLLLLLLQLQLQLNYYKNNQKIYDEDAPSELFPNED